MPSRYSLSWTGPYRVGDHLGAQKLLAEMLAADLRCLDTPTWETRSLTIIPDRPSDTAKWVCVSDLSMSDDFDGLLPWRRIDNRPFLRCMHAYGLCPWSLGREEGAAGFRVEAGTQPDGQPGNPLFVAASLSGRPLGSPPCQKVNTFISGLPVE